MLFKMMSLCRFLFLVLISTLFGSESLAQGNFSTRIVQLPGVQMKDFQVHNHKVYSMNYPARVMVHSDSGTFEKETDQSSLIPYLSDQYDADARISVSRKGEITTWSYGQPHPVWCPVGFSGFDRRMAAFTNSGFQSSPLSLFPPVYGDDPMGGYTVLPLEEFSFTGSGKMVSHGMRPVYDQFQEPEYTGFIQMRQAESTPAWRKDIFGFTYLTEIKAATSQDFVTHAFVVKASNLTIESQLLNLNQNQYAQISVDSNGLLLNATVRDYSYPNSMIFPLPDHGVIESSPFQDTIAGVPQTGLRLVLKNNQATVLWEKKLTNEGSLVNLSSDSAGILMVTWQNKDEINNWWHTYRPTWKYHIVDLNWNGETQLIDTSLKGGSSEMSYPTIQRIDSNRIAISIVSDSSFSFRNQTFYSTSGAYHSFDSWLLFIDQSQTGTQFSYVQNVELCGIDSLQLPVLGFPDNSGPYRIELSDGHGSFTSPITLAQGNQNRFNLHFPVSLPDGDHYTLSVYSDSLHAYSQGYKVNIRFRSTIDPPVVTTVGQLNVCQGKSVKFIASSLHRWSWFNKPDPADTLSVLYNTIVQAVSSFGSCKAFSQEVIVRFIEHHISLPATLQNTVCLPSGAIQLSVLDSGGHWFGEYVDSTGFQFNPGTQKDTSFIYYQNHFYPNCPIDTAFAIIQTKIPALPFVADSVTCTGEQIIFQQDTLSGIEWTGPYVQNSMFSAPVAGTYHVHFSKEENGCFNQDHAKIEVLESGGGECTGLNSLPELGVLISSTFCTGQQYTAYLKNRSVVMKPGVQFVLELSKLSGAFNPILLASSEFNSPIFQFKVKDTLSQGTYRLRLRTMNPDSVVDFPDRFITVNKTPEKPYLSYNGPRDHCMGSGDYQTKWYSLSQLPLFWQKGDSVFQADTLIPIPGVSYQAYVQKDGCASSRSFIDVVNVPKQIAQLISPGVICVPSLSVPLYCNLQNPTWSGPYVNSNLKRIYPPNQDDTLFVRVMARYGASNSCLIDTQLRIYTYRKPVIPAVKDTFACRNAGMMVLPYSQWNCLWTGLGIVNSQFYQPQAGHSWDTLRVTAYHNICSASGSLRVQNLDSLDPLCTTTHVSPQVQNPEFSVFPNPGHEKITVDFPVGLRPPYFLIRDIHGKQLAWYEGAEVTILVSKFPSGLYWICAPGFKAKAIEIR